MLGGVEDILHLDALDSLHAAFLAGVECGAAQTSFSHLKELVQEVLHRRATEAAGVAVAEARRRHGEEWAAEIARASEVAA